MLFDCLGPGELLCVPGMKAVARPPVLLRGTALNILGISPSTTTRAAGLVLDGAIVAAAQEERFTRKKHDADFPRTPSTTAWRGGASTPRTRLRRLLRQAAAEVRAPARDLPRRTRRAASGQFCMALPLWLQAEAVYCRASSIAGLGGAYRGRYVFTEHHESHAASAFFPSPFDEAAILTLDGVGEWATASVGVGRGNTIELLKEMRFPHSLGLLYSAFTYFTGFKVNSRRVQADGARAVRRAGTRLILEKLIDLKDDGSFRLDMDYFDYCHGLTMTSPSSTACSAARRARRERRSPQREMDLAASIQVVTEEIMLRIGAPRARAHRHEEPVPGRRRRAELRRQRQHPARRARSTTSGSSRRRATRAARSGGPLRLAPAARQCPRDSHGRDAQRGSLLGPRSPTTTRGRSSTRRGAPTGTTTTRRRCATRSPT